MSAFFQEAFNKTAKNNMDACFADFSLNPIKHDPV